MCISPNNFITPYFLVLAYFQSLDIFHQRMCVLALYQLKPKKTNIGNQILNSLQNTHTHQLRPETHTGHTLLKYSGLTLKKFRDNNSQIKYKEIGINIEKCFIINQCSAINYCKWLINPKCFYFDTQGH